MKRITICEEDGTVLDTFFICHWKESPEDEDVDEDRDEENFGSHACESLLMDRIRRMVSR